jgi:hypothetical protein
MQQLRVDIKPLLTARFTSVGNPVLKYIEIKKPAAAAAGNKQTQYFFQARRATPITKVTRNTTRNKKKRIFAILAEAPAIDPNPNTAATIAMRKKIKA